MLHTEGATLWQHTLQKSYRKPARHKQSPGAGCYRSNLCAEACTIFGRGVMIDLDTASLNRQFAYLGTGLLRRPRKSVRFNGHRHGMSFL